MLFYLNVLYILYLLCIIIKSLNSLKRNATDNYLHDYNRETSDLAQQSRELCDCSHQSARTRGEKMLGISAGVRMAMLG